MQIFFKKYTYYWNLQVVGKYEVVGAVGGASRTGEVGGVGVVGAMGVVGGGELGEEKIIEK